jgi:hypothetical protein
MSNEPVTVEQVDEWKGSNSMGRKRKVAQRDVAGEVALSNWHPVTVARAGVQQVQVTDADFSDAAHWLGSLYLAAGEQDAINWYIDTEKGQRVKVKVMYEGVA